MARRVLALCSIAVLIYGCSPAPTPAPTVAATAATNTPSAEPSPTEAATQGPIASGAPTSDETSSQALIAADLAAGTITYPQSLEYRAWAAFGDGRLPERYDGMGSAPEDQTLISEIGQLLPSLDAGERAALEPFMLRPSNPASAWSAGTARPATAANGFGGTLIQATDPPPNLCTAPRVWLNWDWSPIADPSAGRDVGFRFWACDYSIKAAKPTFDEMVRIGSTLWGPMTKPEPEGMGLPLPDTSIPQSDGNGKIDVYILDPLAECRPRGHDCAAIGTAAAVAPPDIPAHCGLPNHPTHACTSYILVNRFASGADLAVDFAHEFFHVLQGSHNGDLGDFWYVEAGAAWAEWNYLVASRLLPESIEAARDDVFTYVNGYLGVGHSLVRGIPPRDGVISKDGYRAVVWPMFQAIEGGPQVIFKTWQALEGVTAVGDVDKTIDRNFPWAKHFRDFTAWTAQPQDYAFGVATGLEPDRWQVKPDLGLPHPFPEIWHHEDHDKLTVGIGRQTVAVDIEAADAAYDYFATVADDVREIEIDASGVTNPGNLELQLLARLAPQGEDPTDEWRRIPGQGLRLRLCRDFPKEDVELFDLILSNHAFTRDSTGEQPDPSMQAKGDVVITGRDSCDAPAGFTGTFSGTNTIDTWSGTATFKRVQPGTNAAACEDQGGVYCYELVGGSVTWMVEGRSKVVSLGPPDATGEVILIFNDPAHPSHANTYELSAAPSVDISIALKNGNRQAFDTVRAWMNAITYPTFPTDFHLNGMEDSGTGCGIDGCGPTTTWKWDLTATY